LMHRRGKLRAHRVGEAHVRHQSFSKERGDTPARAIEKLIGNHKLQRRVLFFERPNRAERQDAIHAQRFESINVGAKIQLRRRMPMAPPLFHLDQFQCLATRAFNHRGTRVAKLIRFVEDLDIFSPQLGDPGIEVAHTEGNMISQMSAGAHKRTVSLTRVPIQRHVVKEDTELPNLLFVGTEFGLWISLDGGKQWAQYKGNEFPDVPVRDIAVQARESSLVVATHGRGIWIVDDSTPLRKLSAEVMAQEAAFVPGKPVQQRLNANGGWPDGSAVFIGPNPPDGALIYYYQKKRHIYGKMKVEVFDAQGKLVDTVPANSRRGLSRVEWSMRLKPPRVPPAATAAFEAATGPRVLPGTYTVKMTRGTETYTTPLVVSLDARAKFSVEDRKQNFDAIMRAYNLLGDMTFDVERINGVRDELAERAAKMPANDPLRKQLEALVAKCEEMRKKIVATTEGGAITGEERIREHTTELYGDLDNYEGRPTDYQLARIDSLKHDLDDVAKEFDAFVAKDLNEVNSSLKKKKLRPVQPLSREQWDKTDTESDSAGAPSGMLWHERD